MHKKIYCTCKISPLGQGRGETDTRMGVTVLSDQDNVMWTLNNVPYFNNCMLWTWGGGGGKSTTCHHWDYAAVSAWYLSRILVITITDCSLPIPSIVKETASQFHDLLYSHSTQCISAAQSSHLIRPLLDCFEFVVWCGVVWCGVVWCGGNDINIRSYLAAVVSTEQPAEQAPHDPVRARYFPRCTAGGGGGGGGGTRLATPTRW